MGALPLQGPYRGRGGPRAPYPRGGPHMMRGGPMAMPPFPHPAHTTLYGIPEDRVSSMISSKEGK